MRLTHRHLLASLLCLFLITSSARPQSPATQPTEKDQYLRFIDDNDGGGRLETAITSYKNPDGVTVRLVAAVHVADKKYYADLNKTFATYDALLYEMVKPRGMAVPTPANRSDSVLSMFQRLLKDVLDLDFQLDAIDYSARNFVHADLDAETFARLQEERGESMLTLMLRVILKEMSKPQADQPEEPSLTELLVMLTSPDRSRHLKLILGRQFQDIESKVADIEGPTGSVLVSERDKAAINALKQTVATGKKNIGIFYGAAHMPDLAKRLEVLGFKQTDKKWLAAWDMTPKEGDVIIKVVKKKPATQPAQ